MARIEGGAKARGRAGIAGLLAVVALIPAAPALAHHSYVIYDRSREVAIKGVVKEFRWTNPHTEIVLTVVEGGKAVDYAIEAQSPNALVRVGWQPATLKPGDRVTILVYPFRDGGKGGAFIKATRPDGKVLNRYY